MTSNSAIFTPIFIAAVLFFIWQCYSRFSLVALGKPEDRFSATGKRLKDMFVYAFGQSRVIRRPFGFNHLVIFWAFLVLLLANGEFIVNGILPSVSFELLPAPLYHTLLLLFDIVSIFTLAAVLLAMARRLLFKPSYLDSAYVKARSFDAFLILTFIALLMIAYFGLHGIKIATGQENGAWMPVSNAFAAIFCGGPGCAGGCAQCYLFPWGNFFWWLHALVLVAFLCFLPLSKHMHILTAIPNCFFRSQESLLALPREEFAVANRYGVGRVDEFSWKDLFDSYTCTECGRCQDACPATATGKSLNPRQVVHAVKYNLLVNGPLLKDGKAPELPLIGPEDEGTHTEETIWSCTTCGACTKVCPVLIEQFPKVIKMRRHLVEMEAKFPEELLNLFENMEQRSNPWGIAPSERIKWCTGMEVKSFDPANCEYLFYVGCAGSFDSRQKHVTVALTTILDAAGVSWGILGKEEKCCGDSARRLGNEYLFEQMAKENARTFTDRGVRKVIVQCPHCFTTLRNDYRQYGLDLEVVHYTELISRLLQSGRLKLNRQVGDLGKIVFHDSCYLGRHNEVYDGPRTALRAATGSPPEELPRNRENSFCCGAGGGRMWMEEHTGTRINLDRVEEALDQKAETICVTCPYCLTMFEDGLKDKGAGEARVRDVAEVVAEGLRK